MKIVTIGAGYVGLVSGVCFSEIGHDVICVDKSNERVASLKAGQSPIYEPGLEEMMARNVAAGRLSFDGDLAEAVTDAEAVFICVGTPEDPETGRADLTYVLAAARELAHVLEHGAVVVTKSTVPVGTNRAVAEAILEENPDLLFEVASNPEFLREGSAIGDFMEPDRIVVGRDEVLAGGVMEEIYAPLVARGHELLLTDLASAEIIKYASNAFLATKISFINEIARLCEKTGADVEQVARGMGLDSRIGPKFLKPGPGYGGSCFPKDTSALVEMGRDVDVPLHVTEAAMQANEVRRADMVDKVVALCDGEMGGLEIAVFGVTFKAETDDMRDAPSLSILPRLHEMGARIRIVDPQGRPEAEKAFPWASWHEDPASAAAGADALVILTEWEVFEKMDLASVANVMRQRRLADLRNLFDMRQACEAGFDAYCSLGRKGF